ncbi:hypothetical protein WN944_025184 [Citrus x changshan-huyou]|uniref:Uncharacterized protein n=1 Tax=Citrus x changshan-huyou TaxID=2935761 RepID=A0AAP0QB95_9ROSI
MSELDSDPSNSKVLDANMDMEDDANDSNYMATSEDGVDSLEGDVSLVEETTMDLVEEAYQPMQQLWDHLDFLARSIHGPWLVGGDFNSILCSAKKKCGSTNTSGRLDKVVSNMEWLNKYPYNVVLHPPKIASDYRPILVRFTNDVSSSRGQKPFRFLAAWLTDNSFSEFVFIAWLNNLLYLHVADTFVKKKVLETNSRQSLAKLELKLKKDLKEVLTQEETLWLKKSRKDWLIQGDRNTAYFYQKTLARRRRNRITTIQDDNGEWLLDNESLSNMP